jgi:hypothetical protein
LIVFEFTASGASMEKKILSIKSIARTSSAILCVYSLCQCLLFLLGGKKFVFVMTSI